MVLETVRYEKLKWFSCCFSAFVKVFPIRNLVKNHSSAVEVLGYMHTGGRRASERFPPISAEIREYVKCRRKMHRKAGTLRGEKCRKKKVRVCWVVVRDGCPRWQTVEFTRCLPVPATWYLYFVNVIGESSFSSFRAAAATLVSEWLTAASEWLFWPSCQSGCWEPHVRVAYSSFRLAVLTLTSEGLLGPSGKSGCWDPHVRMAYRSFRAAVGTLMSEWLLEPSYQSGC